MPRQNIWTDKELEEIFENYLASQFAGHSMDTFSLEDFQDDDDTFTFLDESSKLKSGRPKKRIKPNRKIQRLLTRASFFKK